HRALDVRRRHVLARGVDDQFLLAVDDAHVAGVVDGGDVAGAQPAVGADGLGSAFRVVAVALHDDVAAHEQLTVVGHLQLDAVHRRPDRTYAYGPGPVGGGDRRQLGHSPALTDRNADRGHELQGVGGDGR